MKKQRLSKPLPFLSDPRLLPGKRCDLGDATLREWTGKIQGKSLISYRFRLPRLSLPEFAETERYLEEIRDAYLSFLAKKSEEMRDGVFFGGLEFQFQKNTLILSAAFCPFEERTFSPCVVLTLSPKGAITRLSTPKKVR